MTLVQSLVPTSQKEAKRFLMSITQSILDILIGLLNSSLGGREKWCQVQGIWGDTSKNPAASHYKVLIYDKQNVIQNNPRQKHNKSLAEAN